MKVKNLSSRLHHIGDVSIAPGETAEIQKDFEPYFNKNEILEVKDAVIEKNNKKSF